MSTEQNKAAVHQLNKAINSGDLSSFPDLFHPDCVFYDRPEVKGVDEIIRYFSARLFAYPDYHEQIDFMVAGGDLVVVFYTISGSYMKAFRGISLTGESFCYPVCVLARFKGGKQTEAWPCYDTTQAFQNPGQITRTSKSRSPLSMDAYAEPQTALHAV